MRFAADSMLGRLTRWLRLSGYDARYLSETMDDEKILDLLRADRRVLLTRDWALYQRARGLGVKAVFIESCDIVKQLKQVIADLGLRLHSAPLFSRCPVCNGEISRAGREELEGDVPENVLMGAREFWRCADCGKVYWEGKHWENIRKMVEEVRGDV